MFSQAIVCQVVSKQGTCVREGVVHVAGGEARDG